MYLCIYIYIYIIATHFIFLPAPLQCGTLEGFDYTMLCVCVYICISLCIYMYLCIYIYIYTIATPFLFLPAPLQCGTLEGFDYTMLQQAAAFIALVDPAFVEGK